MSLLVDGGRSGAGFELHVPTQTELVGEIVEVELGRPPSAPIVAVLAGREVVAERSRPGWHLHGLARDVRWTDDPQSLLVLGVDEGDNEIIALIDVDAPGVGIERTPDGDHLVVRFDDVAVDEPLLVHRPDVRSALADRLTVLDLIGALRDGDASHAEHRLRVAVVRAAAISAATGTALSRQHDVSSAAVVVLQGAGDGLLDWHRRRLVPLI